jgi:hypothetical protein
MAINLHCEQILCDLSRFDPPRFIRIAVPYATVPTGGSEGAITSAVCVMLCVEWLRGQEPFGCSVCSVVCCVCVCVCVCVRFLVDTYVCVLLWIHVSRQRSKQNS